MQLSRVMYILALVFSLTGAAQNGLTLTDIESWKIVSDENAIESERYASEEFQRLFQEMTGHLLPIIDTALPDEGIIFVGPGATAASGLKLEDSDFSEEELHIQISETAIHITGGRPRGTLYGVYEFFEEYCGALFLTHNHTYFPEDAARKKLKFGSHRFSPAFEFRWSQYAETTGNPAFAASIRTNTVTDDPKFGGRTGYRLVGHNVAYLVPPSVFGETHPEYYALVDGHRKLEMEGGGPQLCMSNPEVLDVVTESVLKEIEKNPAVRNISVAHMDNVSYCRCEDCAAIDSREESHAGATLSLVNAVAERIEKTHPDVFISTYAYQYTRKPPRTIHARKNVMIQLCSIECCVYHAVDDPACTVNQKFCDDLAGWKEKADNIFIWHYNTNFRGYLLPFPNFKSIGRSVDYYVNNNGRGVYMQAATNTLSAELSDLRNYVMSRCLWKPGRDSWKEARTFIKLHYAEAAGPVLEYLDYYHTLIDQSSLHPACFPTESAISINADSALRISAYFKEALRLAETETVRGRVEKASLSSYRALLSVSTMNLVYEDGLCKPYLEGVGPELLEEYAALCEKYKVTRDTEHILLETYLANMRKLYAGMKAAKIENDYWRVVLLPESNAKIIEMTYKPSGRNIIQPSRAFDRFRNEEWVRQGEGPRGDKILPFEVQVDGKRMKLYKENADGSRIERTITLKKDVIRFDSALIAGAARTFDFIIHPEYDTATSSDDPDVLSLYVRNPEWVHANAGWQNALPTEEQLTVLRNGAAGGAFTYFNHEEKFGVEQRFTPGNIESIAHFWSPARRQINLELFTPVLQLKDGEKAEFTYEIRYLNVPPMEK